MFKNKIQLCQKSLKPYLNSSDLIVNKNSKIYPSGYNIIFKDDRKIFYDNSTSLRQKMEFIQDFVAPNKLRGFGVWRGGCLNYQNDVEETEALFRVLSDGKRDSELADTYQQIDYPTYGIDSRTKFWILWSGLLLAIILLFILFFYCCCCRPKKGYKHMI